MLADLRMRGEEMKIAEKTKMKKLLMTLVLLPLMVLADTEMVDGITWT